MVRLPGRSEFYNTYLDDAPSSVFVNMEVGEPMPDPARPLLLVTRIWLEDPNPIGLASSEELDWIVENGLFRPEEVCERLRARFAGHIVSQGCIDAFYDLGEAQAGRAEEVLSSLWPNVTHKHAHSLAADGDWDHYRNVLYPSPLERRIIQNRERLEQHIAESPSSPSETGRREVLTHYVLLPDEAALKTFTQAVEDDGFGVVGPRASSAAN